MSQGFTIPGRRARSGRRRRTRLPLAQALAGPTLSGAFPGFDESEDAGRIARFLTGSAGLHLGLIALLFLLASLAPPETTRILKLQILEEPVPVVKPEPPPPVVKPKPPRAKPLPPPPVAKPLPEPVVAKPEPAKPPPPKPKQAPRPQIEPMKAQPAPPPPQAPVARSRPEPATRAPQVAPDLAIDRLARADATATPSQRSQRAQLPETTRRTGLAPSLSLAPALALPAAPAPTRGTRSTAATATRRPPAPPRPSVQPAAALPTPAPAPPQVVARARAPRPAKMAQRPTVTARQRAADPRQRIPGVSLGSLAPCLNDAREQALKQRVVAAAAKRASCESPSGRFHFIETKNVNAFLMGIERAPGKLTGDRCQALAHALDCLAPVSPPRSRR